MTAGRRSMLLMIAFVTLWTCVEVIAAGVLSRLSPYQVVWTRYVVHLALMLLIWGWHKPASLWRTRRPTYQFARAALMVGMPASWVTAMQMGVHPTTLMTIFWLSPLLILGFARLVLGEVASRTIWLAALIGWIGAFLATGMGPLPGTPLLLLLPLGMAATFSLYVVMTRSLRSDTTRANLFYTALGAALILTPFMPEVWVAPSGRDWLTMIAVGVLGFITLLTLDRMAAHAPVSQAAPMAYLQIPASVLLLAGVGHGTLSWRVAAGMLLIAAVSLVVWSRENQLVVREAHSSSPLLPLGRLSGD